MALAAGKLRHRVALQQQVETQDPVTGEVAVTWQTQAEVWGAVEPLSAREFIAAQSTQSQVTTRVTIRQRSDVTAKWRVLHRGRAYNVHGVLHDPVSGLEYMTLPCSEGTNDGR
jgi:SPP1 family predicted phage head-tail adaptor